MRPPIWNPPHELSAPEQNVAKRIRSAKLFLFLRKIRHQLFDRDFQEELGGLFKDLLSRKMPDRTSTNSFSNYPASLYRSVR